MNFAERAFRYLFRKKGKAIEKDDRDVCVISKELAELNHLKTGNLLKFNDYHDKEHSTMLSITIRRIKAKKF